MKLMKIPNLKAKLDLLMTVYEFPLQVNALIFHHHRRQLTHSGAV